MKDTQQYALKCLFDNPTDGEFFVTYLVTTPIEDDPRTTFSRVFQEKFDKVFTGRIILVTPVDYVILN